MLRTTRLAPIALAGMLLVACAAEPMSTPAPTPTMEPSMDPAEPMSPSPTTTATVGATSAATASPSPEPSDPLLAWELTDVRSGESFTLAELAADGGPVLLEPMARWCSSCQAQQHEVVEAHASGSFTSVSLGVDLSETPEDMASYADEQGWDWRFAMADAALYRLLQERFGDLVIHPPSTPLIVIEADGTVRPLAFGVGIRSAEQLLAEIGG